MDLKSESQAQERLASMIAFDEQVRLTGSVPDSDGALQLKLFSSSYKYVIGVDEVGRGCLAGPLMAGAVLFSNLNSDESLQSELLHLRDSKQLGPKRREELSRVIRSHSKYGVGYVSHDEVDQINVLNASLLAMHRAVNRVIAAADLEADDAILIVDGRKGLDEIPLAQVPVSKADSKSASVAAASIIAKVYRDKLMLHFSKRYPEYGWDKNKGYPSKLHVAALHKVGRSPLHRLSFTWSA